MLNGLGLARANEHHEGSTPSINSKEHTANPHHLIRTHKLQSSALVIMQPEQRNSDKDGKIEA